MGLVRYRLGELIQQRREKYDGISDLPVRGVSRDGFILPKQEDADKSVYNVFYRNDFVFNPARMEINSIAFNSFFDKAICSSLYEIFYVVREDILLPEYLDMYIQRSEFARRCWFEAIGSVRNYFRVSSLSEFILDIPPIDIQRKYAGVYTAMKNHHRALLRGIEDLRLVCDLYIEDLRRKIPCVRLGDYIRPYNVKNSDGAITLEQGINIDKQFITPQRSNSNLYARKIVRRGMFAYCTQLNNERIAIAYRDKEDCVVSSVYDVFEIIRPDELIPEYLMIWLTRSEFGRFVYWASEGSAYEFLRLYNELCKSEKHRRFAS